MRPIREMFMRRRQIHRNVFAVVTLTFVAALSAACGDLTGPTSPSTPTGVTATLTGPTSARVTWTPSPLNDGVISYSIFRNGTKIGESETTTFTDTGLSPQTTYVYSVAANCKAGIVSDRSVENAASTVTTVDITPPTIVSNQPPANFVGVSPAATVTVTFSESMDPATINTTTFTVRTAAGTPIAGTVSYSQTTRIAEFRPSAALPNPVLFTATVTTGVKDLAGNALAAPFTWNFTTRDDTPPTVSSTTPAAGASNVSPGTAVTITFNEAMDSASVVAGITMKVTSSGAAMPGTATYNRTTRVATFTPSATLAQTTGYTVTVATSVKDVAGNSLATPFVFAFTTGDTTLPSVTGITPLAGQTNVPTNTAIVITFSEPVDQSTVNTTTLTVRNSNTNAAVAGTFTFNPAGTVATFTPSGPLSNSTSYTVTVTTGVKDLASNPLTAQVVSTFTTVPAPDTTRPTILSRTPTDSAVNVALNANATVTFSEPMDSATINSSNILLTPPGGGAPVAATVTCSNSPCTIAVLDPTTDLLNNTRYTLTVTTGVRDRAGNQLAATSSSVFTTLPDTIAPTVVSRTPTAATGVARDTTVTFTFSENMDPATITTNTVTLVPSAGGAPVTGTVSYNVSTRTATFKPAVNLAASTTYVATVTTGAKDLAGNQLAVNSSFTFTTGP
ncbi:MAG TPA: Ig-like domain-containing protein [Gemmatimonadaceae bacterium]|nr:Ig-like domain-containing protein [Gemmatimonadaceae bacterium]